jgi:hypothetical protein
MLKSLEETAVIREYVRWCEGTEVDHYVALLPPTRLAGVNDYIIHNPVGVEYLF